MIALVQTAFLGDVLLSIPLARSLARVASASGQPLVCVCRKGLKSILEETGLFRAVIEVEKKNTRSYDAALAQILRDYGGLGATAPGSEGRPRRGSQNERGLESTIGRWPKHLFVVPHKSLRTRLWVRRACRALGAKSIGFDQFGLSWLFTETVNEPRELPDALRQLSLLQSPLFSSWQTELREPMAALAEFHLKQELSGGRFSTGALLPVPESLSMQLMGRSAIVASRQGDLVAIAPGSMWDTKRWDAVHYSELIAQLTRRGLQVSLIGSPEERELCDRIRSNVKDAGDRVQVLAGRMSLAETARYLATVQLLVCNDSGAMHLASLSQTETVAIYGPTVLDFGYRPWSSVATVIEPPYELKCRPCGSHGHRKCPIGTHECMHSILPETVLAAVLSRMQPSAR